MKEPQDPASVERKSFSVEGRAQEGQPVIETIDTQDITEQGVAYETATRVGFCGGCGSVIREPEQIGARCHGCSTLLCSTNECSSVRCEHVRCRQSVCPACRGEAFSKTYCREHLWHQNLLGGLAVMAALLVLVGLALSAWMVVGSGWSSP